VKWEQQFGSKASAWKLLYTKAEHSVQEQVSINRPVTETHCGDGGRARYNRSIYIYKRQLFTDNRGFDIKLIHCINLTILSFVPPLWSSGQSSWLQIQRSGFDSQYYQIFWEVVGLERGPLSLVSTIQELLERKSIGSCLENLNYGSKGPAALTTRHLFYPQKLTLALSTNSGRSAGIVRLRTKTTELILFFYISC
jgi:hypothetical protein